MSLLKRFLAGVLLALVIGGTIWGVGEIGREEEIGEAPEAVPPTLEKPLRFAVMADIHLDSENFKKALRTTRENGSEFVIIAGDLTSLGKKEELVLMKKILDENGLEYYVIPGNHDLWYSEKIKVNVFREIFGWEYQAFKKGGVKFILVNNGSYLGLNGAPKVGDGNQRFWLEKEVEECLKIVCLVFAHIPLNHPVSTHVMGENNPGAASEAGRLVNLLVENKVREVFAGHLHFSSSYEIDGLRTTVVGAITKARNLQSPKFLEARLDRENFEKKEVFVTP